MNIFKVNHFILSATIALTLPLATLANSIPDLCAQWASCTCNKYNFYIENNSNKPWSVLNIVMKQGNKGLSDQKIEPGEIGFSLA